MAGDSSHYAPARSTRPRLARSSSTTLSEEGASARRWTRAETRSRVSEAPEFRWDPPSDAVLDYLALAYLNISGQRIRSVPQRDLLAACYRVHGDDVLPYIADEVRVQGTTQNLLGIIRCAVPREMRFARPLADNDVGGYADADAVSVVVEGASGRSPDHDGQPCPIERCLPNLVYCEDDRPAFDPASRRRFDRRPSNPDAARFFAEQAQTAGFDASAATWIGPG
jgi:hypothetical protein